MKLSARKLERDKKIALNMTSMIDVVFLLLIFFIVAASFVETEHELSSAIRVESTGTIDDLEPAIVDIVPAGSGFVYHIGGRDLATAEELLEVLERFPPESKIDGAIIRVSDDAPFDMAAAAVSIAREQAGFKSVTYVPKRSK